MNDIKSTPDEIEADAKNNIRRKILNEFLETFPIAKLQDMTLKQYTNLKRNDSFCY